MSTIKSSTEHLTLNADGSGKDIKFQANGVEKASISSTGAFTSTSIDATKLSGALPAIDGSALTGVGKVLQVVQAIRNTNFSSSATSYTDTGLSGSITPSSTSSKILVFVSQQGFHSGSAADVSLNIVRGSTQVTEIYYQHKPAEQAYMSNQIQYLDSPSTTSAVTYKTQVKNTQGRTIYFSWGSTGNSYITLMEIGA